MKKSQPSLQKDVNEGPIRPAKSVCKSCGWNELLVFYEIANVPLHSVLLIPTHELAINFPTGDIELAFCPKCGFISNIAFNPGKQTYSSQYEETQAYSPTFIEFHRRLAAYLIDRYQLYHKTILEIGCGKGEFLALLCELGNNSGIGFDPAYVEGRIPNISNLDITFITDFFSERYAGYHGDLYCCKMTLEHIQDTAEFINTIRRSIGERFDTTVFFQVPDMMRILKENAFWDIYYEHCSYFCRESLRRLFQYCGFDVLNLWEAYDNQYLMIEARPKRSMGTDPLPDKGDIELIERAAMESSYSIPKKIAAWQERLEGYRENQRRVVLWGAGSKAVAFLTTIKVRNSIQYTVDINPQKQGTYMAGTGQKIMAPEFLKTYRPDVVIAMNPIYQREIQQALERMSLTPLLLTSVD